MFIGNDDITDGPATPRASLRVKFDSASDDDCTVCTVTGQDEDSCPLLVSLTAVFTTSGLRVMTASISSEEGQINDVFRLQTADGDKVCGACIPALSV